MSAPLKHRADLTESGGHWEIDRGEFAFERKAGVTLSLHFWPADCPCPLRVAIKPHALDNGASWTLTGTDEAPTLHPSINAINIWHGWLRGGVATQ